jgi:hypothetical protein
MVDTATYRLMHPPESESESSFHTRLDESTMLDERLPDASRYPHFSLLLPPKIKGFGFHNKKWSQYQTIGCIDLTNL